MAVLYQVWVPAVVVAHVVGVAWLAWSVSRLFGGTIRKRVAVLASNALRWLPTRQTQPEAFPTLDLEAQVCPTVQAVTRLAHRQVPGCQDCSTTWTAVQSVGKLATGFGCRLQERRRPSSRCRNPCSETPHPMPCPGSTSFA